MTLASAGYLALFDKKKDRWRESVARLWSVTTISLHRCMSPLYSPSLLALHLLSEDEELMACKLYKITFQHYQVVFSAN